MNESNCMYEYKDSDTEYTVKHKAFEEGMKISYDGLKHLTTLNTGAILITLAIFEKLFTARFTLIFLIPALCIFLLSTALCSFGMIGAADIILKGKEGEKKGFFSHRVFEIFSYASFLVGLTSLGFAVIINLATPKP